MDGKQRLLPRHDRRSDRRQADGAGHAVAVARAGNGPDGSGGAVRQRLRLRLSEQPVVVVADDAAAVRGAPRVVFERLFGEGGSSAERRAALGKRASLLDWVREDTRACRSAWRGRSHEGQHLSGDRSRGRAAHSEAEAQTLDNRCPISSVPSACRRIRRPRS